MIEINPCFFCKRDVAYIITIREVGDPNSYAVYCPKCKARGPEVIDWDSQPDATIEKAIDGWNGNY